MHPGISLSRQSINFVQKHKAPMRKVLPRSENRCEESLALPVVLGGDRLQGHVQKRDACTSSNDPSAGSLPRP